MNNKIYFARDNESVKIPTKRDEDAGYDVFANFKGGAITIEPHHTVLIPTGLRSAFDKKWYLQLVERGSTGTKGMAQRCGVIDSGFRGEWFVPITNTTNNMLVIAKDEYIDDVKSFFGDRVIIYPYTKAICQAVVMEVPIMDVEELSVEQLMSIESERGTGKIGSSNK